MNVMIRASELPLIPSSATLVHDHCARDQALANFVAELFSLLHPATLPMLERMFEDVKQDAETDGETELKRRAEIGIAAARIAAREQEAIEN